jgi:hypothetical protein
MGEQERQFARRPRQFAHDACMIRVSRLSSATAIRRMIAPTILNRGGKPSRFLFDALTEAGSTPWRRLLCR